MLDPAAAVPEVARQRPGLGTACAGGDPDPVGGRQPPRADRAGERERVVVVDQARVRGVQRRLAQIPVRCPVELVVAEPAAARHPGQPEVGRLRQDRGVQDARQLGAAAGGAARRRQVSGEPGPAVDLDQQLGQPDLGQPLGDELAELPGRVLVGGLFDDEFALVELCAGFRVERGVEPFDELGLLAGELVEAFGGLKRLANPCCELGADRPPLVFWQQVAGGVGVPAAALDPYAAGPERCSQLECGAQLVGATVKPPARDVRDQRPPSPVDERAGGEAGQPAPIRSGELGDQPQRPEQLIVVFAGAMKRQRGVQLAEHLAAVVVVGDQQVKVRVGGRADDPLSKLQVLAEALKADPPVDQPEHVGVRLARFQQQAGDVDEPPEGALGVAAVAAAQLVAPALRATVGCAERPIEHLERVVGHPLERL